MWSYEDLDNIYLRIRHINVIFMSKSKGVTFRNCIVVILHLLTLHHTPTVVFLYQMGHKDNILSQDCLGGGFEGMCLIYCSIPAKAAL